MINNSIDRELKKNHHCMCVYIYIYISHTQYQSKVFGKICNVFFKEDFCSPSLHLFDSAESKQQKCSKNSNKLKTVFYFNIFSNVIYSFDFKADFFFL